MRRGRRCAGMLPGLFNYVKTQGGHKFDAQPPALCGRLRGISPVSRPCSKKREPGPFLRACWGRDGTGGSCRGAELQSCAPIGEERERPRLLLLPKPVVCLCCASSCSVEVVIKAKGEEHGEDLERQLSLSQGGPSQRDRDRSTHRAPPWQRNIPWGATRCLPQPLRPRSVPRCPARPSCKSRGRRRTSAASCRRWRSSPGGRKV